jgi:hypothetical protein
MLANFLDTSGHCWGFDPHQYIALGPEGIPLPIPLKPHFITAKHNGDSRTWRIARTVTTDGNPVLQGNWAMILVAHFSIPVPEPHPLETVMIAVIIGASSAAPQLTVHAVTGENNPLLTEISGSDGLNLDCGDLPALSYDYNANTVMTTPSLGDYLGALVSAIGSYYYSWAGSKEIGLLLDPVKKLLKNLLATVAVAYLQTLLDYVNYLLSETNDYAGDPIAVELGKIATALQGWIDGIQGKGRAAGH